MTPTPLANNSMLQSNRARMGLFMCLGMILAMLLPEIALASGGSTSSDGGTTLQACGFLSNVSSVLNAVSIVVVTIAIIFTGYKVAFAHARISEVAPVMIGAILIGAATQIAKLFLGGTAGSGACSTSSGGSTGSQLVTHALDHVAAVVHLLGHYA